MKNLILIGKSSYLTKKISESNIEYENIYFISTNDLNSLEEIPYLDENITFDIVDCNVITSKKSLDRLGNIVNKLKDKVNKYVLMSTKMHNKEGAISLSTYRKYKLMQEELITKTFPKNSCIVRSPDILDSPNWLRFKIDDAVFKLYGIKTQQILIRGISTKKIVDIVFDLLKSSKYKLEIQGDLHSYLVIDRVDLSVSELAKYMIYLALSKSIYLNEIKAYFFEKPFTRKNNDEAAFEKGYFVGGFHDLDGRE